MQRQTYVVNEMRPGSIRFLLILSLGSLLVQCGLSDAPKEGIVRTVRIDATVSVAAFSPNGEFVATVDRTNLPSGKYPIKIWQTSDGRLRYVTGEYSIYNLTFSPDNTILAASCGDGVRLFRMVDGQLLRTLDGNQLFSVAFAPDGQSLAAAGAEGEVRVWHVADGAVLNTFALAKHITSLAFSPNGKLLAAGTSSTVGFVRPAEASTDNNPIALWRLSDGQALFCLAGHKFGVLTLAFSGDGQTLASGGSDGFLRIWRLETGGLVKAIPVGIHSDGLGSDINDLDFTPDGKSLAVATGSSILIFKSTDLSQELTLQRHNKAVLQLQYSQDSHILFSAGEDNTVRLWRL